jgi:hypothetical protein
MPLCLRLVTKGCERPRVHGLSIAQDEKHR